MAHWRTLMDNDNRYVAAYELGGKDVTLKIKSVGSATVEGAGKAPKRKLIITFEGARKPFLSNPTNNKTIASLYGTDADGWVGKSITLYATTTSSPEGVVDCIRVRPIAGVAATE